MWSNNLNVILIFVAFCLIGPVTSDDSQDDVTCVREHKECIRHFAFSGARSGQLLQQQPKGNTSELMCDVTEVSEIYLNYIHAHKVNNLELI